MFASLQTVGGSRDDVARIGLLTNTLNDMVSEVRRDLPNGFVDEFADGSGIDGALSSGYSFESGYIVNFVPGSDAVPAMTGNTGSVIYSSQYANSSYYAFHAFDDSTTGNVGDYWYTGSGVSAAHIGYDFGAARTIANYSIMVSNDAARMAYTPRSWTFEGWNGSAWLALDTNVNVSWSPLQKRTYAISAPVACTKYRVNISANNGGEGIDVAEIEFLEASLPKLASVVSDELILSIEPSTAWGFCLVEEIDAQDVNSDLIFSGSKAAVPNWSASTLENFGDFGTGLELWAGDVPLLGTGQNIRVKVDFSAGLEARIHAWGVLCG